MRSGPSRCASSMQPPRAGAAGGELGAQVRAALVGLAHLPGELVDRGVVEHAGGR